MIYMSPWEANIILNIPESYMDRPPNVALRSSGHLHARQPSFLAQPPLSSATPPLQSQTWQPCSITPYPQDNQGKLDG